MFRGSYRYADLTDGKVLRLGSGLGGVWCGRLD
jgi:hypothetical protein